MIGKKQKMGSLFDQLKQSSEPTIIESVCTNCFQSGQTTILLVKIPFFREVMLTSFCCESCGNKNNEVQFAGQLPDYGVQILFRIMNAKDLNRDVIKSEYAKIIFEELDLEIPESKKSEITTIESLLMRVQEQLCLDQQLRKQQQFEQYTKIQEFLNKLREYKNGQKFPLTMKMIDPSGNSAIKNPYAPKQDKNLHTTNVPRTLEELSRMGYSIENAKQGLKGIQDKNVGTKMNFTKPFEDTQFMKYEPVLFDVPCHSCQMPGQMKMCQVSVPYFTDLVIMSFVCDYCGTHSTETKNSGQIKDEGCIITLQCQNEDDLKRDLFKSETCAVQIPDIELQLDYGTLGGVFTTVEGLLQKVHDHLSQSNPFKDSDTDFSKRMTLLLSDIEKMRLGEKNFKLILNDPLAHSFLQNPYHPCEDPRAKRTLTQRTEQQKQFLGLNDIKVEGYQESLNLMKKQNHKVLNQTLTSPKKQEQQEK